MQHTRGIFAPNTKLSDSGKCHKSATCPLNGTNKKALTYKKKLNGIVSLKVLPEDILYWKPSLVVTSARVFWKMELLWNIFNSSSDTPVASTCSRQRVQFSKKWTSLSPTGASVSWMSPLVKIPREKDLALDWEGKLAMWRNCRS